MRLIDADALQKKLLEIYPQAYYPTYYRQIINKINTATCLNCQNCFSINDIHKNGWCAKSEKVVKLDEICNEYEGRKTNEIN